ncbi:MAG: hypothetical protein NT076_03515 [Candidatus Pacearchaeota archaeon]|nr:hypothetical protein [Candidatus Pacearchaeota archaeon]
MCLKRLFNKRSFSNLAYFSLRNSIKKELNKEEIEIVSKTTIEKEEVLYYIEAKTKRAKASYSTQKVFDKNEAENLRTKAINFVNKAKEIIDFYTK